MYFTPIGFSAPLFRWWKPTARKPFFPSQPCWSFFMLPSSHLPLSCMAVPSSSLARQARQSCKASCRQLSTPLAPVPVRPPSPSASSAWRTRWAYPIKSPVSLSLWAQRSTWMLFPSWCAFMIVFFANACGVEVSTSMMIVILLANVILSVGTPGIPGGAIASCSPRWLPWRVSRPA